MAVAAVPARCMTGVILQDCKGQRKRRDLPLYRKRASPSRAARGGSFFIFLVSQFFIHYVSERLAFAEPGEVIQKDLGDPVAVSFQHSGNMGRNDDIVQTPQLIFLVQRFRIRDVESGAGQFSALEGFYERRGVNRYASSRIDEYSAVLHESDPAGIDHAACRITAGHYHRNYVGARQHTVQLIQ